MSVIYSLILLGDDYQKWDLVSFAMAKCLVCLDFFYANVQPFVLFYQNIQYDNPRITKKRCKK